MATDIVLKDRNGQDVTYKGIETVTFDTPTEGVQTTFTHGTVMEGVTIEPDFSDGVQVITVPDGSLVKEATIVKPAALVPENIRAGTNVAGVVGELIGDTEEVTVDLDMENGGQIITPTAEGKVMSKVVVTKPGTLVPENIAEGVNIGGVIGTHKRGDFFITYMSEDGTETLHVKPVMYGDTCGDVIALGFIDKPIKEATETEDYTFQGWATSIGGKVDSTVFDAVTEDKTVYAVFASASIVASGTFESGAKWLGDIQSLVIEDGITSICALAFYQANALTSVAISDSVASIGKGAFRECAVLTSVTIPDSITSISEQTFYLCDNLATIIIPDSVVSIGQYALACNNLLVDRNVYYEGTLEQWLQVSKGSTWTTPSTWYFNGEKVVDLTIPDGITQIPALSFNRFMSLERVTFPDGITSVGNSAFYACKDLASVVISSSVAAIGYNAFGLCSALESAEFKDDTTWFVGSSAGETTTQIDVTDTATAATYLSSTYAAKHWTKVD